MGYDDHPALQARIIALEQENASLLAENGHLKKLLADAGIAITPVPVSPDPNQGERIIFPDAITTQMANRFFSYFWGRQDVYAKRSVKKGTGAAGYYRQCANLWRYGCHRRSRDKVQCKDCEMREDKRLTIEDVKQHLEGNAADGTDVIGIYPMLPDDTCRFIVFDFDNHAKGADAEDFANTDDAYREEVNAVRQICSANGIAALTERSRSGRGAHIWIFFEKAIPAALARRFGNALLEKGMERISVHSFTFFDRMIPMQDHLSAGGIGNLIALPLQGQALRNGNSAFIDEDWNACPDQWAVLWKTPRLTRKQVEDCIAEWSGNPPLLSIPSEADESDSARAKSGKPWEKDAAFHSEDVNGILLITLVDGIYVNTGNLKPRLQNQIRWLAAFKNPVFYKNLAMGIANFDTPRIVYLGGDEDGHIHIPQGLTDRLLDKCDEAGIPYSIDDHRTQNRHGDILQQVDRGLDVAISEYAPGRSIVVDKKTYVIGGLYNHVNGGYTYRQASEYLHDANYLKRMRKCGACGWFGFEHEAQDGVCPFCKSHTAFEIPPMVRPWGFSPRNNRAEAANVPEDYSAGSTPQYSTLPDQDGMMRIGTYKSMFKAVRKDQRIIIMNTGKDDEGFTICCECGAAIPGKDEKRLKGMKRPGSRNQRICNHNTTKNINLGYDFLTDMLVLTFNLPHSDIEQHTVDAAAWLKRAATTAAEALKKAATIVLDVEYDEIQAGYRVRKGYNEAYVDVYLYDSLSSGAGYCAQAGAMTEVVLKEALRILRECECDHACQECLKHYRNQRIQQDLDRFAGMELLEYGMNMKLPEVMSVDEAEKQLAPVMKLLDGYGIRLDHVNGQMTASCDGKHKQIIVYPAMMNVGRRWDSRRTVLVTKEALKDAKPHAIEQIVESLR